MDHPEHDEIVESVGRIFAAALVSAPLSAPSSRLGVVRLQLRVLRLAVIDVGVVRDECHPLRRLLTEVVRLAHHLESPDVDPVGVCDELDWIRRMLHYADRFREHDYEAVVRRLRAAERTMLLQSGRSESLDSSGKIFSEERSDVNRDWFPNPDAESFDIFGSI
jgi:hypothetical protein